MGCYNSKPKPRYISTNSSHRREHSETMGMMGSYDDPEDEALVDGYNSRFDLPHTKLEDELIRKALGDCTGYKILDLGGERGEHARRAIDTGARQIDLVDMSMQLMEIGEEIEANANRDIIRWHMADITRPLNEQAIIPALPKGGYDMVMAIWKFDHAGTVEEYEGIWKNVATYLKPGGRFVGCRMTNPWSLSMQTGKYGVSVRSTEPIPGGVKCQVVVNADPPFSFESQSMEESLMGHKDVPESLGMTAIQSLKAKDAKIVRSSPDFWADFVDDPYFTVFTARKTHF